MLIICQIDWSEIGVAVELQCLRNCTLSSLCLCTFSCLNENRQSHELTDNLNIHSLNNFGNQLQFVSFVSSRQLPEIGGIHMITYYTVI